MGGNMKNYITEFLTFCIGLMFGLLVTLSVIRNNEAKAVANGCAQYNEKTGDFEWIAK